jgi:antitoxin component of MazEF toxin-antitoxin module
MGEMRKITVEIPADLLAAAQVESGAGVTETVRQGLVVLKQKQAFRQM